MKIRTQLILAFLLLAIVPLSGIVLYSYYSSLRAVRRATEAAEEVIAGLTAAAESWAGDQSPKDDITFVVIRVR